MQHWEQAYSQKKHLATKWLKNSRKNLKSGSRLDDRREHARNLYIENLGKIPDVLLAKTVGVNRNTIGKWRKKGDWENHVEEIKHSAGKKVAEKQINKIAAQADAIFDELFATTRLVALAARRAVITTDAAGRPITDASGLPVTNSKLTPAELRSLMSTMGEYQKIVRLQLGQHTESTKKSTGRRSPRTGRQ